MDDVIVVGASLAGVSTAIHLRRLGHSVTILDRASFPRRKPCGEGLFPGGVAALQALGDFRALISNGVPLESVRFTAGDASVSAPLSGPGGEPGLGVRRELLDSALVAAARDAGITVRTGCAVTALHPDSGRISAVETPEGPVAARAFVGADGLQSRLRRLSGLDGPHGDRYGVTAHLAMPVPALGFVDVYFEPGYELYLTPVGGPSLNVALLMRKPAMKRFAGRRAEAFLETIQSHQAFAGGFTIEDTPFAAGPFQGGCSRAWRGNLVLVGDAAGFFDGISGEGMTAALAAGSLAAAALHQYLASGSRVPLRTYDHARRQLVRNSNLLARLSLLLSRHHSVARQSIANLARQPETFRRLVAISSGTAPLRSLRMRDILALAVGR